MSRNKALVQWRKDYDLVDAKRLELIQKGMTGYDLENALQEFALSQKVLYPVSWVNYVGHALRKVCKADSFVVKNALNTSSKPQVVFDMLVKGAVAKRTLVEVDLLSLSIQATNKEHRVAVTM